MYKYQFNVKWKCPLKNIMSNEMEIIVNLIKLMITLHFTSFDWNYLSFLTTVSPHQFDQIMVYFVFMIIIPPESFNLN